jgi:hypothetical protein
MISIRAGRCGIVRAVIWVFTVAVSPMFRQSFQDAQRFTIGAGDAAELIVQRLEPIDRDAEAEQAGIGGCLYHLAR